MPASRPGQVPRPRLTARLDEGLARGLILVCAPAGYGKTVLLANWVRRSGQPVAWLSLDAGDNDPARFWRHAAAALDRARPGIAQPGDDEALLVLDDYHVIGSRQVHESLAFLLEHLPAGMCVVLASRSDPPLPLPRLRARGELAEVREAELRFTPAEARKLLQQVASALPDASVAALAARMEGWAAGLQLAALSLRGQDDAAAFVAAFTGSHRYVLDYLAEEVLERQDKPPRWAGEPFEPTAGVAVSLLINVPALTTLHRSYLAQLRGDAEATAAFATQALAEIKPGERALSASAHGFLAVAEWLRAGSRRPNAPSRPASPGGTRPASSR